MDYRVALDIYKGPLDLLLYLIQESELDIYDIPIATITDQYMKYLGLIRALFPTGGLFLGPTHAIQVGSPLENVLTMYRTAGSLTEKIDSSILDLQDGPSEDKINMSKLF